MIGLDHYLTTEPDCDASDDDPCDGCDDDCSTCDVERDVFARRARHAAITRTILRVRSAVAGRFDEVHPAAMRAAYSAITAVGP